MSNVKISTLLIAILLVGGIVGILSIAITNIADDYDVEYDNSSLETFNKMQEITNLSENVQESVTELKEAPNFLSKLDAFFGAGYDVLKVLTGSIDISANIGREASNALPIEEGTSTILANLWWVILIILVAIGVILAAVLKWGV